MMTGFEVEWVPAGDGDVDHTATAKTRDFRTFAAAARFARAIAAKDAFGSPRVRRFWSRTVDCGDGGGAEIIAIRSIFRGPQQIPQIIPFWVLTRTPEMVLFLCRVAGVETATETKTERAVVSMQSIESANTITRRSIQIASTNIRGGQSVSDLGANWTDLYRDPESGRYFLRDGAAFGLCADNLKWLSRAEAIDWIASEAQDAITGYGYSVEEAVVMVGRDDDRL